MKFHKKTETNIINCISAKFYLVGLHHQLKVTVVHQVSSYNRDKKDATFLSD